LIPFILFDVTMQERVQRHDGQPFFRSIIGVKIRNHNGIMLQIQVQHNGRGSLNIPIVDEIVADRIEFILFDTHQKI